MTGERVWRDAAMGGLVDRNARAALPMSGKPKPAKQPKTEAAGKGGRKKLLLLLALALLLAAIGAGLWFGGILPPLLGMDHEAHAEAKEGHGAKPADLKGEAEAKAKIPVFMDLPDMVANLNVGQRRSSFIKLKARIELAKADDQPTIQAAMPRLQDLFTTYLRETRPEELRGAAGSYRLREELLARANIAVTPARIVDVLFTEMIVQ
jgi:flagellar FliL protein